MPDVPTPGGALPTDAYWAQRDRLDLVHESLLHLLDAARVDPTAAALVQVLDGILTEQLAPSFWQAAEHILGLQDRIRELWTSSRET